jgi:hypothetical protein
LAGARTGNAVVISGKAMKVHYRGISDVPGPVTVRGLVPSDEGRRPRMMDRAYIFAFDGNWHPCLRSST